MGQIKLPPVISQGEEFYGPSAETDLPEVAPEELFEAIAASAAGGSGPKEIELDIGKELGQIDELRAMMDDLGIENLQTMVGDILKEFPASSEQYGKQRKSFEKMLKRVSAAYEREQKERKPGGVKGVLKGMQPLMLLASYIGNATSGDKRVRGQAGSRLGQRLGMLQAFDSYEQTKRDKALDMDLKKILAESQIEQQSIATELQDLEHQRGRIQSAYEIAARRQDAKAKGLKAKLDAIEAKVTTKKEAAAASRENVRLYYEQLEHARKAETGQIFSSMFKQLVDTGSLDGWPENLQAGLYKELNVPFERAAEADARIYKQAFDKVWQPAKIAGVFDDKTMSAEDRQLEMNKLMAQVLVEYETMANQEILGDYLPADGSLPDVPAIEAKRDLPEGGILEMAQAGRLPFGSTLNPPDEDIDLWYRDLSNVDRQMLQDRLTSRQWKELQRKIAAAKKERLRKLEMRLDRY